MAIRFNKAGRRSWGLLKVSGIKLRLLLIFTLVLIVITLLNISLTISLTNQQSERDAFGGLTQQAVLLQNDLQQETANLQAFAEKETGEIANLSDLATLYAQNFRMANPELAAIVERSFGFNKTVSINRLQVVLRSAGFSSIAVYMDNELSHYVTTAEAGISVIRNGQKTMIVTAQNSAGDLNLSNWPNWSEGEIPQLIAPRVLLADRPTVSFDFSMEQMVIFQFIIPVQATTQTIMKATISLHSPEGLLVENLAIATPETLNLYSPGQEKPQVIGAFVFKKIIDLEFLEEVSQKTGFLPALYSPDGIHQIQIVDMKMDPADLAQWVQQGQRTTDPQVEQRTLAVDQEAYYQALALLSYEDEPRMIIGFAQSGANAALKVRETVSGLVELAGLVLLVGWTLGYVLFDRLVKPIRTLTAAVSQISLNAQREGSDQQLASDKLVDINLRASDEVGQLTAAFNEMIRRLQIELDERKQAEREIQRLNQDLEQRVTQRTAQLEAANKELEAFAYSVSHDLRAPLRHIDGFLQLLQQQTNTAFDEKSQHYMKTITDSARRMGTLIDDLLFFSRMAFTEIAMQPVDLTKLTREVLLEQESETLGRTIHWQIGDLPIVSVDLAMLRIVLTNLITNAIKFTKPRDQAEIEIGCQQGKDEVVIFVRDNGVGFNMAYADKLFSVFQRLHRVEDFEGTGIGLANVQRIIARHGGRTWAEGVEGQGATFYIALPSQ